LGGSDPFIVLADANPAEAAEQAARARTINAGQSCIAAKRFIVEEPVAAPFEQALTERMAGLKVGDPLDRTTDLGPLAREDLLDALGDQVRRTLAAGAELRTGGTRLLPHVQGGVPRHPGLLLLGRGEPEDPLGRGEVLP
jgi:succinate-semialdehyde dehydrogenase/glutarate-semialdehyde dehydrogenase